MISGLIVKVAFIVVLNRFTPLPGDVPHIQPTLRVSQQLSPVVRKPKVTIGLSKVSSKGEIQPIYVERLF